MIVRRLTELEWYWFTLLRGAVLFVEWKRELIFFLNYILWPDDNHNSDMARAFL